jgi:hypothetical protein
MTIERPDPARRRFLAVAAAASAVSAGSLAVAAMPPVSESVGASDAFPCRAPQDDRRLLELEEQIFEQYEGACAFDAEIMRLSEIWTAESRRLYEESLSKEMETGTYLTPQARWALVTDMPECREHSRLTKLQDPFYKRMDALVKVMFATPAHTAEGRRAKATVLLGCIMGDDWRRPDAQTDYPEMMARKLLIEFIGGEPGEVLRAQFADATGTA